MSEHPEKKPSSGDVAARIAAIVYNAGREVSITDKDLKAFAQREKLREGFKKPIIEALGSCGYEVSIGNGAISVSPPPERERPLTLAEAMAESEEAIRNGVRVDASGGTTNAVMKPDGSGFL